MVGRARVRFEDDEASDDESDISTHWTDHDRDQDRDHDRDHDLNHDLDHVFLGSYFSRFETLCMNRIVQILPVVRRARVCLRMTKQAAMRDSISTHWTDHDLDHDPDHTI